MNLYSLTTVCLVFFNIRHFVISLNSVENVDDTDLIHLLTSEDNVIALFTKSNCLECDELESVVQNIHEDLKENLEAVVVKAHNSHMVGIYNPSREPSLIYFRRGIPLLYYGKTSEDEILSTFQENKEPVVKELSDDNFEHLTQASSGATTGDWFIFFYSADCVLCQRLYAVWEAVGAKLKRQLNVARVNRADAGLSTAKRFSVTKSPEFLFIRQGKVYGYTYNDYTPKAFVQFAEKGYKQAHPYDVPTVPSVIGEFFSGNLKNLSADFPLIVLFGLIALSIILLIIVVKVFSRPSTKLEVKRAQKNK